jgi:hypothetical protein
LSVFSVVHLPALMIGFGLGQLRQNCPVDCAKSTP